MKTRVKRFVRQLQGNPTVHVLHIGKTGGTALRHALEPYENTWRRRIRFHPHHHKLRDIPENEHVIFLLRDPVARFVSGFYSRQRQGQPRFFVPWSDAEKQAYEWFDTPNKLALALSLADERARAETALRSIRHVSSSYWDWFDNEGYFRSRQSDIFFVGYQEHLAEDFERLRQKLGLPKDAQLPNDEVHAHRNPSHVDRSLDDQAVKNLQEWYREDYRFIQLCQEIVKI